MVITFVSCILGFCSARFMSMFPHLYQVHRNTIGIQNPFSTGWYPCHKLGYRCQNA